ncbi:putative secreted effector protein [Erysiphe necator]|uniref:Putative secreted effector protein n=1 Tax=Uncinula necator TaxID=52586 RepID=A0A0B1P2K8_UNCNE|nr:putative secreted effector protein [Erysiphe necator]
MRRLILITFIALFVFISTTLARTGSTVFTRSSVSSHSPILKRQVEKQKKNKGRLVAYRCVLNVYKREQLIEARNEACKYINKGKKTWGFTRWPKPYKPPNRLQFPFYSNTFRLWPLEHDGKLFKGGFFKRHLNNFIVLDGNCQFAGVVALYKSKAVIRGTCPIIGCHAPVVKEYKNCEPMKVDGSSTVDSGQEDESDDEKDVGTKRGKKNGIHKEEEREETEEVEEEEEEEEAGEEEDEK